MVMTESHRPSLSAAGLAATLLVATLGWITSPVWACPADNGSPNAPLTPSAAPLVQPAAPWTPSAAPLVQASELDGMLATELDGMLASELDGADGSGLDGRLRRIEGHIERLAEQLEQLRTNLNEQPPPLHLFAPDSPSPALTAPPGISSACETRSYTLPKGKLDALACLMARPDVPITVSIYEDYIDVVAAPAHHATFLAVVGLIHPPACVAVPMVDAALPGTVPAGVPAPGSVPVATLYEQLALNRLNGGDVNGRRYNELLAQAELIEAQSRVVKAQSDELKATGDDGKATAKVLLEQARLLEKEAQLLRVQAGSARKNANPGVR